MAKWKIPMGTDTEKKMKKPQGGIGTGLLNGESTKMQTVKMEIEYIRISDITPNKKNQFSMGAIEELAQLIDQNGLEQPLVVRKDGEGGYILLTGHRRLKAIQMLQEQGKWTIDSVPCVVKNLDDIRLPLSEDLKENLAILSTNQTRDKTEADKLLEYRMFSEIYRELKAKGVTCIPVGVNQEGEELTQDLKGVKKREFVASSMGVSTGQVSKYEAVEKKGIEELKNAMLDNKLNIQTAEKIARMDPEEQKEILSKNDVITSDTLQAHEDEKKKKKTAKETGEDTQEYVVDAKAWADDIKELTEGIERKAAHLDQKQYMNYLKLIRNLEKLLA